MFTLSHEDTGQCTRRCASPLKIHEIRPHEHSLLCMKEDVLKKKQIELFNVRWKKKGGKETFFSDSFNDLNILAELAWASRDPAAKNCPLSQREVRRRLGFISSEGKSNHSETYKNNESLSYKSIHVDGIGEMALSDESANLTCNMSFSNSDDDEKSFCERIEALEEFVKENKVLDPANLLKASSILNVPKQCKSIANQESPDYEEIANSEDTAMSILPNEVPPGSTSCELSKNGVIPQTSVVCFPNRSRSLQLRIDNTSYLLRSPTQLAHVLLYHLISTLIAMHQFNDAVYFFGIYLLVFPRASYVWININDFRLLQRFFTSAPDVMYSSMRIKVLEQCYGNPTFLRHEILYDITFLYCLRREPDKAIEFLEHMITSRITTEHLIGTLKACMAWASYAKLLKDSCLKLSISLSDRRKLESATMVLVNSRSIENVRLQLETAVLHLWKQKMIFPTPLLRLLVLCNISYDMDKLWSFVQDFLAVSPTALDLVEIKMLLLQLRVHHWDMNDYIAASIDQADDRCSLANTCLHYSDLARGESSALALVVQSFPYISLSDRLRCVFYFLDSNPFYPPAWRILVDETLGFIGSVIMDTSTYKTTGSDDALALWTLVDHVLGPTAKLHWHRRMFDSKRTILSQLAVGSQIFVLLVAPFFISTWDALINLARYISLKSFRSKRKMSLVVPRRHCFENNFFTSPETTEMDFISPFTHKVLGGFSHLLTCVLGRDPSFDLCDCHSSFIFNTYEFELLTEAALRLTSKPSIELDFIR